MKKLIKQSIREEAILLKEYKTCYCYWTGGFGPDGWRERTREQRGCEGTDRCSCSTGLCIPNPIPGNENVGGGPIKGKDDTVAANLRESIKRHLLTEAPPIPPCNPDGNTDFSNQINCKVVGRSCMGDGCFSQMEYYGNGHWDCPCASSKPDGDDREYERDREVAQLIPSDCPEGCYDDGNKCWCDEWKTDTVNENIIKINKPTLKKIINKVVMLNEIDYSLWDRDDVQTCCDGEMLGELENTPCCDYLGGMISTGGDDGIYSDDWWEPADIDANIRRKASAEEKEIALSESTLRRLKKNLRESQLLTEECKMEHNVKAQRGQNWADCGGGGMTCGRKEYGKGYECQKIKYNYSYLEPTGGPTRGVDMLSTKGSGFKTQQGNSATLEKFLRRQGLSERYGDDMMKGIIDNPPVGTGKKFWACHKGKGECVDQDDASGGLYGDETRYSGLFAKWRCNRHCG